MSIDAAGCQKEIAAQIVSRKADCLLAVKDNQPRLFEDVERLALAALESNCAGLDTCQTDESKHGRAEFRFCFVMTDLESIRDRDAWAKLKSVVCVVSSRRENGATSNETRCCISCRDATAKQFLAATRGHWGIENNLHWVLDVAFREDQSRLREGHAPENMALVRKLALAMLKNVSGTKVGIKNRRLNAGWDGTFLERIFCEFMGD